MSDTEFDVARSDEQIEALSLLQMAQKTHDEMIESARKKSDELICNATDTAEKLISDANEYRRVTLIEADSKAEELVSQAEIESVSIIHQANAKHNDVKLEISALVALEASYRQRLSDVFAEHAAAFGLSVRSSLSHHDSEIELPSVDDVDAGPVGETLSDEPYQVEDGETVTVGTVDSARENDEHIAAIVDTLNEVHAKSTGVDNDEKFTVRDDGDDELSVVDSEDSNSVES